MSARMHAAGPVRRTAWGAPARGWLAALCAALAVMVGAALWLAHSLPAPFATVTVVDAKPARRAVRVASPWPQGTVDVNSADAEALTLLTGVGPKLAEAIVAERERSGPFRYPEDMLAVKGIGEKKLEGFRAQLAFSGPSQSGR